MVVSNLVRCLRFYAEELFRALLRSFADLRLRSFVRICVFLRPTAFKMTAFGNCRLFDTKFGCIAPVACDFSHRRLAGIAGNFRSGNQFACLNCREHSFDCNEISQLSGGILNSP